MISFLKKLILLQEKRQFHFISLFLFISFVGIVRALEENLLFQNRFGFPYLLTHLSFYYIMSIGLTVGLHKITGVDWKKASNSVLIGIFLGIFPPWIDLIIEGRSGSFYYSYYQFDYSHIPLLFYAPEYRIPLGECIIVWLSILFCGLYTYIKTQSTLNTIYSLGFAYFLFFLTAIFIPMDTFHFLAGIFEKAEDLKNLQNINILKDIPYYTSINQLFVTVVIYLLLKKQVLSHLLKRSVHALPFLIIYFLGFILSAKEWNYNIFLNLLMLYLVCMIALVQNGFYDKIEDSINKINIPIEEEDVYFFNLSFLLSLFFIYELNLSSFFPLLVFFIVSVLYSYPFYRAKAGFPANLKIEGIWGSMAFLTGFLSDGYNGISNQSLIILFLVFGGWSIVSPLKDVKDLKGDKRAKINTPYIFFQKRGFSFSQIHKVVFYSALLCFLIPIIYFLIQKKLLVALFLILTYIAFAFMIGKYKYLKKFSIILFLISLYLGIITLGFRVN